MFTVSGGLRSPVDIADHLAGGLRSPVDIADHLATDSTPKCGLSPDNVVCVLDRRFHTYRCDALSLDEYLPAFRKNHLRLRRELFLWTEYKKRKLDDSKCWAGNPTHTVPHFHSRSAHFAVLVNKVTMGQDSFLVLCCSPVIVISSVLLIN
jgi:hypothetical protein